MIGDILECYVDNLVVMSWQMIDHLGYLRVVFDKLHQYQLKMLKYGSEFTSANS